MLDKLFFRRCGLALCLSLLLLFAACTAEETPDAPASEPPALHSATLRAAVLYDGSANDGSWQDTLSWLDQSLTLGFSVQALDADAEPRLGGYDIIFADDSLLPRAELAGQLADFAAAGGALCVGNAFHDWLAPEVLGADSFVKIDGCPTDGELTFPEVEGDLAGLQQAVADFAAAYVDFTDYAKLSAADFGWAMQPSTATALVELDGAALYTVNRWGEGWVLFTNPLLPNAQAISGFSLTARSEQQSAFSATTAACNQLLVNEWVAFVQLKRQGYALSRVYGSFTRPGMAWELHYEEMTAYANRSGVLFGEACKQFAQLPSYVLVRDSYYWFLRTESVTYLLGDSAAPFSYDIDRNENAYSSGTHIAADGQWLTLGRIENAGSYFYDYPEYDQSACPQIADLDGDGLLDILCGSEDGLLYFFAGQGFTDRLHTAAPQTLNDADGRPLRVAGYSAPALADVDGDGRLDIISGSGDGRLYWFANQGGLSYEYRGVLGNVHLDSRSLPAVGDWNSDGCADIIVGSNSGALELWLGDSAVGLHLSTGESIAPADCDSTWLSPQAVDWDADGADDLALGTAEGSVLRLLCRDGAFTTDGYLRSAELNFLGNDRLLFRTNCAPCFADINHDGATDIIAGSLEYGLACPIDSAYFPYRDELQASVDYIKDNYFYAGVHFYTHAYASAEREDWELAAHQSALRESYGLETVGSGANQHTWYSSSFSPTQSLLSLWRAGLLWDSGYAAANAPMIAPQNDAENAIVLPFFLEADGEETILAQNCSTVLYQDGYVDLTGRNETPVCLYYHMDFCYTAAGMATALADLQRAEDFRRAYAYDFVGEDQLMRSIAAARHLQVEQQQNAGADTLDITLTPAQLSTDYALYDADYAACCGVKIRFSAALDAERMATDAAVWYRGADGALYVALDRPVRVWQSDGEQSGAPHIQQINIPATVTLTADGAEVQFLDNGLMQLSVSGTAVTDSAGWTTEQIDETTTRFSKYGAADTLRLSFGGAL